MVVNLTRYEIGGYDCGQTCTACGMEVSKDGEYVKFEDAMEATSNSLQQLKAEIAALISKYSTCSDGGIPLGKVSEFVEQMRQLSAV